MADFTNCDDKRNDGEEELICNVDVDNASSEITEEELRAIASARDALLADGLPIEKISIPELALTTINCKLKVNNAVKKYKIWMEQLEQFGIKTFDDIWIDVKRDGSGDWNSISDHFQNFCECGKDANGRSIMWIRGRAVPFEEERQVMTASVLYFYAVHCDFISLRNGITFVLDTRKRDMTRLVGNESKLQRAWQAIPLRPQALYIIEPSIIKRTLINSAIYIASLFVSEKVLGRIKFVEAEDIKKIIPHASIPRYEGGDGGGVDDVSSWVRSRLEKFKLLSEIQC